MRLCVCERLRVPLLDQVCSRMRFRPRLRLRLPMVARLRSRSFSNDRVFSPPFSSYR